MPFLNNSFDKIDNNKRKFVCNAKMATRRTRVSSRPNPFGCVILGCSTVLIMCLIVLPSHVQGAGQNVEPGICSMLGCNCTVIAHHWINVKCIFSDYQVNAKDQSVTFEKYQFYYFPFESDKKKLETFFSSELELRKSWSRSIDHSGSLGIEGEKKK